MAIDKGNRDRVGWPAAGVEMAGDLPPSARLWGGLNIGVHDERRRASGHRTGEEGLHLIVDLTPPAHLLLGDATAPNIRSSASRRFGTSKLSD
jgi:hypothetical protein